MNAPVIITALGGSGTRVVARLVRAAGIFIGANRNESEDAMEFVEFYDRWINRYLLREQASFCSEEEELMHNDFLACVARHRLGIPAYDAPWGWKEPRSHFLLPFLHAKYPDMKLIHLIRDGRDMAFSTNQNQLRKHGTAILGPALCEASAAVQSAALWSKVNLDVAVYAEAHMRGGYLMVRFEDLCEHPFEIATTIVEFINGATIDPATIMSTVEKPQSFGRWQRVANLQLSRAVMAEAAPGLEKFLYVA